VVVPSLALRMAMMAGELAVGREVPVVGQTVLGRASSWNQLPTR
jgi:hypothetical protein